MDPAADGRPEAVRAIAEAVRAQLIEAALDAWEQAGLAGLCHDGRFEFLIGALRRAPLDTHPPAADRDTA